MGERGPRDLLLRGQGAQGALVKLVHPLIVADAERIAADALWSSPFLFFERRVLPTRHRLFRVRPGGHSLRGLRGRGRPLAEIVPTWAISSEDCTFLARRWMSLTTAVVAISMPRLRSIGFIPAATSLRPSFIIEAVSTVAVVVPSPAMSLVFEATWRTIWAPIFSNLSSSSISLATVTPSLVMRGAPYDLSRTTLRPLGPSVAFTALLRISTPRSIRSRASTPNLTSLADIMISVFNWSDPKGRATGRVLEG